MPSRFLIIRGGAIGDFILTVPVMAAIREQWPAAHLEVLGYPHIADLAKGAQDDLWTDDYSNILAAIWRLQTGKK